MQSAEISDTMSIKGKLLAGVTSALKRATYRKPLHKIAKSGMMIVNIRWCFIMDFLSIEPQTSRKSSLPFYMDER